jgi:hypothetical protein
MTQGYRYDGQRDLESFENYLLNQFLGDREAYSSSEVNLNLKEHEFYKIYSNQI